MRYPPEWIHDPTGPSPSMELADVTIRETWEGAAPYCFLLTCHEAMEALVDAGLAKNIGVSNFNCQLLMDLLKVARIKPAVNQVSLVVLWLGVWLVV